MGSDKIRRENGLRAAGNNFQKRVQEIKSIPPIANALASVGAYLEALVHLAGLAWSCVFAIVGSLLVAVILNGGVSQGTELLSVRYEQTPTLHPLYTCIAAAYCISCVATSAVLAIWVEGKEPGAGDLIPFWAFLVVFFSVLPSLTPIQIPLTYLFAIFAILFIAIPIAWLRWNVEIADVKRFVGIHAPAVTGLVLFFIGLAAFIAVMLAQVAFPRAIGAIAIVCTAVGFWSLVLTTVFVVVPRLMKLPTLTIVALLLIVWFGKYNDDRTIRVCQQLNHARITCIKGATPGSGRAVPLTRALVDEWIRNACGRAAHCPMIFVAAEGGGLRAAYWTAAVLQKLNHDTNGQFYRHLFAVSTVSGGSMGAAEFIALNSGGPSTDWHTQTFDDQNEQRLLGVIDQDYLSPLIAAYLFPEVAQRFCPVPIPSFDRALWFERALQDSWHDKLSGFPLLRDRVAGDFLNVESDARGTAEPIIFMNATNVELGKRFIMSNVYPVNPSQSDAYYAFDPAALYHLRGLPLSAAIHLSSRFTYVSPAGVLNSEPSPEMKRAAKLNDVVAWGRIADGGYYDNSGAATLVDAISQIQRVMQVDPLAGRVAPYVIVILNNPQPRELSQSGTFPDVPRRPREIPVQYINAKTNRRLIEPMNELYTSWSDFTAPVETFLATRDAHGLEARLDLEMFAADALTRCSGLREEQQTATTHFSTLRAEALMPTDRGWRGQHCGGYFEISYPTIELSHLTDSNAALTISYAQPALGWILAARSTRAMRDAARFVDSREANCPITALRSVFSEPMTARCAP